MEIKESGLIFSFDTDTKAVKFDDTRFYREDFNKLNGGKGVDILASSPQRNLVQFIEIKNCTGKESENKWRLGVNNSSRSNVPNGVDEYDRDSLDIEVSRKVAMTISCMYGAWTCKDTIKRAEDLTEYWKDFCSADIPRLKRKISVSLFLEGDFGSRTRTKKMVMQKIQDSLNQKLKWLNCKAVVVDSNTYNRSYYSVINKGPEDETFPGPG